MKENYKNSEAQEGQHELSELDLHNTILRQHEILLRQQELLQKNKVEKEEEFDLSFLVPGFLKNKSTKESQKQAKRDYSKDLENAKDQSKKLIQGSQELLKGETFTKSKERAQKFNNNYQLFFKLLRKKAALITLFFLAGVAGGVYVYKTAEPLYESNVTLQASPTGEMRNSFFAVLIEPLERLTATGSHDELANRLNMQVASIEKLKELKYRNYLYYGEEETDSTFAVDNRPFFRIKVQTTDNSILPVLEKSLLTYLKSNAYVQQEQKVAELSIETQLEKASHESKMLDSLRLTIMEKIRKDNGDKKLEQTENGNFMVTEGKLPIDPMMPFDKTMEIFQKELKYKQQKARLKNTLRVVDGFAAYSQPVFPRVRHIAGFSGAGLILGVLFAALLSALQLVYRKQD